MKETHFYFERSIARLPSALEIYVYLEYNRVSTHVCAPFSYIS